jgi:hypothetical protein
MMMGGQRWQRYVRTPEQYGVPSVASSDLPQPGSIRGEAGASNASMTSEHECAHCSLLTAPARSPATDHHRCAQCAVHTAPGLMVILTVKVTSVNLCKPDAASPGPATPGHSKTRCEKDDHVLLSLFSFPFPPLSPSFCSTGVMACLRVYLYLMDCMW